MVAATLLPLVPYVTPLSRPGTRSGKLNAIYNSDVRHFDVIDMRYPVPEAYELVEGGCITPDNFRDFVFAYTVHLRGTQNPKFLTARRWPRRPPGWRADSSS